MKNLWLKFKNFFQKFFHNIRHSHLYRAYLVTIIFGIILLFLGMHFEHHKTAIFNNKFLSDFMHDCFQAHDKGEENIGYNVYYLLLYFFVLVYIIPSLIILIHNKTNSKYWCIYIILLSVIFLVFINAYLTEMLQYETNTAQSIYEMHLTSFISVTSIIIGIAGIKITVFLNHDLKNN